ncbi:hypothetical protein [uncultured Enterovirga sp.]|uniref:hypothetical protein n=1 Tax=uncultured Enterovirga sp. TaxID=2026352 RepID=UPI0035CA1289
MQTQPVTLDPVTSPVVVFGRDDKGKPHASRFEAAEAPLAERAAGLMGMQVLRIASEDAVELAAALPSGRIFASGKGFVPFVRADLFAKLVAAPGAFAPPRLAAETDAPAPGRPKGGLRTVSGGNHAGEPPAAADGPGSPPADWAGLKVGSLALAAEEGKPAIWYAATIVADRGDDLFELRWLDDGDGELPLIVRRREHLGLFPPALAGALA